MAKKKTKKQMEQEEYEAMRQRALRPFKPSTAEWPDGRIRDLVKAGALIAAEIDRLLNLKK